MTKTPEDTRPSRDADQVSAWLARLFMAAGVGSDAAATVAEALVEADLDGVPSHGLLQAPIYLKRLLAGSVSTAAEGRRVTESEAVSVFDGDVVLGALAAQQAMADAIARARRHGIAAAAVRRGFHFGAAGRYARMASSAGLIGIAMCNSRAMMPAPGGAEPVVGNNPLAIAVPTADGVPLVLDMAMSETSIGRIRVAAARGEELPPGWALDSDGRPTTDPAAALSGMLVPIAGAKGFGLALMIDLLTSLLSGGAGGTEVTSFYEGIDQPAHCSYLFIAIDPAHFGVGETFAAQAAEAAARVRDSRPADGVDRLFTPGERRYERHQNANGKISIAPTVLAELNALAGRVGVPPLEND